MEFRLGSYFLGLFPTETYPYVSHLDGDLSTPTVFHLGSLSVVQMELLLSGGLGTAGSPSLADLTGMCVDAFRYGVRAVDDLYTPSGDQVGVDLRQEVLAGHPYPVVPDAFMDCLPLAVLREVGRAAIEINHLAAKEAWNLRLAVYVGNDWRDHRCTDLPEARQRDYGWDGRDAPAPVGEFEGEYLMRCPVSLVSRQSFHYLRFYQHYKSGYLPQDGGLMHQPNKALQAFEAIDSAVNRFQSEIQKRQEEIRKMQNRRKS